MPAEAYIDFIRSSRVLFKRTIADGFLSGGRLSNRRQYAKRSGPASTAGLHTGLLNALPARDTAASVR